MFRFLQRKYQPSKVEVNKEEILRAGIRFLLYSIHLFIIAYFGKRMQIPPVENSKSKKKWQAPLLCRGIPASIPGLCAGCDAVGQAAVGPVDDAVGQSALSPPRYQSQAMALPPFFY